MKTGIFDFDGTLFESSSYWEKIVHKFLVERGVTPPQDLLMVVKPLGIKGAVNWFKNTYGLLDGTDEVVAAWRSEMGDHYRKRIPLHRFAHDYLCSLKSCGVKLCMATAMEREFVEAALLRTGIAGLFDHVVTIEDVKADKTSPALFLHCAEKTGATPEECTVYEDSCAALKVARMAGFKTVGVFDGVCRGEIEELKSSSDKFIMSYEELM